MRAELIAGPATVDLTAMVARPMVSALKLQLPSFL
jgi:hypothetical protein